MNQLLKLLQRMLLWSVVFLLCFHNFIISTWRIIRYAAAMNVLVYFSYKVVFIYVVVTMSVVISQVHFKSFLYGMLQKISVISSKHHQHILAEYRR